MLLRDTHKGGACCYRDFLTRVWPPLWGAFFVSNIFRRSANQVLWRISCGKIWGGNYCRAVSNWWSHYATVAGCPRMWRRFCVSIYCLYLLVLILRHLLSTGLLMLLWYNLILIFFSSIDTITFLGLLFLFLCKFLFFLFYIKSLLIAKKYFRKWPLTDFSNKNCPQKGKEFANLMK